MNAMLPLPDTADASPGHGPASAEAAMARALVERLAVAGHKSTAEMLHELRRAFPDSPLSVRVRALEALRLL